MVLEKQELKLSNLISLRKKMTQQEMALEMKKLGEYIKEIGAEKNGPVITATFGVEQSGFDQILSKRRPFSPPLWYQVPPEKCKNM